jgi:hypothetical protein
MNREYDIFKKTDNPVVWVEAVEEDSCQAVSPNDEPCHHPATVGCTRCGRWFCDAHAEDDEWHSCALPPGERGEQESWNPQ